jgi:hypothetical protein
MLTEKPSNTYVNAAVLAIALLLAGLAAGVLGRLMAGDISEVSAALALMSLACSVYTLHTPTEPADTQREATLVSLLSVIGDWQERTFGPGLRWAGILAHIQKESIEISATKGADPREWVDIWLLASDGLRRSLQERHPQADADEIAEMMEQEIISKHLINAARTWPDWQTVDTGQPIEHVRT